MKRMLSAPEVYLYRESVNFRKSINGLAAIIESDTDLSLGSGALFLFTNKQRDKIKVLYWDKTGFDLWYKRLEKAKYKWPTQEKNQPRKSRCCRATSDGENADGVRNPIETRASIAT
ncbi:IS66 family insertion sequence element accessory protein TnpB [Vibrio ezurae]|uniref:Putative transposase n=1 Tax=Vibrio ezurae NBRC 102218 TaxID=1219080 RepID=U3AIM0_9VIBR|nr:IS66 family insertion sequence element accessory protein TnpB [Vibrio ezurae]GAD79756.1 putative transposase [Vibrio ezurae NBRC 102218]